MTIASTLDIVEIGLGKPYLAVTMQIDYTKFKDLYLQTAQEYVDQLTQGIHSLSENISDLQKIPSLHIAAHSLKGQSLAIGFPMVGRLSYILEKVFYGVKGNTFTLSPDLVQLMQESVSKIEESLHSIAENDKEVDLLQEIEKLEAVSGIKSVT